MHNAHLDQMAEIASDTATNESFMAQYGWLDRQPVTEERSGNCRNSENLGKIQPDVTPKLA